MRNHSYFAMPCAKTVNHGLESLSYLGSKLWDSIPSHMKEIDSINEFKHAIKTWNIIKYWIFVASKKKKKKKSTYMNTKIHRCLGKSEYHNRFFPFALTLYICFSLFSYLLESLKFI